jgi:RNA polymerase sporulation-specific sigma factor
MATDQSGTAVRPTQEEERRLWELCLAGDEDVRERLILLYRPLVFWLAGKLRVSYQTHPDLIQEGMLALIRAVDRYDPGRNIRFSTYATYRVRGQMINYLERIERKAPIPLEEEELERPEEEDLSEASRFEWRSALESGMRVLPESESMVVQSLILQGRKAADVAKERGVDVSRIYRIQKKALARLRTWLLSDPPSKA